MGTFDSVFAPKTVAPSPTFKNAQPAGTFSSVFSNPTPPPIVQPIASAPSTIQKIGSAVKTGAEDTAGFFGSLATGLYNQFANPSADEQTVEKSLTSAPQVSTNPLIQKPLNVLADVATAPAKAYLRFIEPMILPYATDLGQTIGGQQIVNQINQGKISQAEGGKVLNDLGVVQKTAPQIIGDAMSAVLAVFSPEVLGKITGVGSSVVNSAEDVAVNSGKSATQNIFSKAIQGAAGAAPIGAGFGVANVLQSGTHDPKTMFTILGQNLAGAMILGGVTGGLTGAIQKPLSIPDAIDTVEKMQAEVKSPQVSALLDHTLQSLRDRQSVGSINDSNDIAAPASAQLIDGRPADAAPSNEEIDAMAKASGAPGEQSTVSNLVPKQNSATVDLTKPGDVTDIVPNPAARTPMDALADRMNEKNQGKPTIDILPPKTSVTVGDSAIKYDVVSDNGTNVKVTNTETGNESVVPKSTVQEVKSSAPKAKINTDAKVLEDTFKDDPQFKGTTFKEQSEIYNKLLKEDRNKLFDIATEKIPTEQGAVPSAMAELLAKEKDLTPSEKERLGNSIPYATSKGGQALSLSRIADNDSGLSKLREAKQSLIEGAGGEEKVTKSRSNIVSTLKDEQGKVNLSKEDLSWEKFINSIQC